MKTMSVKKWSILGLVLMAASAVTAAILPKNTTNNKAEFDGTLTISSEGQEQLTCRASASPISVCNYTTASASSTALAAATSDPLGNVTVGNTTIVDQAE